MPLTNNALPSVMPGRPLPFDTAMAFANGQTLTATGYVNAIQSQIDLGAGRFTGYLALDVSALKLAAGDETYQLLLLASNDPAFANGNVELLAVRDFAAAAAGRLAGTICPPSNAVPITGKAATRFEIPFSNQMGPFILRFAQLRLVAAGTAPSITLAAWIAPDLAC